MKRVFCLINTGRPKSTPNLNLGLAVHVTDVASRTLEGRAMASLNIYFTKNQHFNFLHQKYQIE